MNLKATIAGVIGVTAVAGTLVFNTDAAQKVWDNIEALSAKITAFADNDTALKTKYDELRTEANTKIASLETKKAELETEIAKLKQDAEVSADQIAQLTAEKEQVDRELELAKEELLVATDEMARLEKEVEKANKAITELEKLSTDAVEKANKYKMTDVSSLPGLAIAEAKAYFQSNNTQVTVTLKEDINIHPKDSKGNIEIRFKDAKGTTVTKNKTWSGYLNSEGIKYGTGTNPLEQNKGYENSLKAGNTFSTTLSVDNKPWYSKIDATNIVEVQVTVTNNDGEVHKLKVLTK